ncbi:AAA family ATPase [Thalassovita aquimarina]|uniref:AAA family ATPase n=1 Tax=Thalassovita aquimarina TaxID=2785917 RepID=A0ABS5HVK2_9RHOB|nr:AAA family ATPase [Thalassovita aquimarina]MBR9653025.1 AAA family ATPase [Thalassovita aquimarina]
MTSSDNSSADASPILACTISRDVQNFDLLIEDMEAIMGEAWGDLGFNDALAFFQQPGSESLEFIAIAIDRDDEDNLVLLGDIISAAKGRGIKVILIAEEVTPAALHQLLRQGADEFVPYPLPENELQAAVERLRTPEPVAAPAETVGEALQAPAKSAHDREGVVLAVHGLAGGTGATTLAVNLGWELVAAAGKKGTPPRVCIIDLDLQYGSVSTYLDLARRDAVYELLSDTEVMDDDIFTQALMSFEDKLFVLTAPKEMLPLDLVGPEDIQRIIDIARHHFDYVIIDMPKTLVQWSETVLSAAHVYFATLELDMRSAQNALRMKRALQAEDLPFEKLRFVLNRAPKFTDLSGKSRVKRLADSLDISIELQLPDGGKYVTQAGDHGEPLEKSAAKNPLRKEIAKLAASLHELGQSDTN